MSNVHEHEFRLDVSVFPASSVEMYKQGYKGTVHFRSEMTAPSLVDAIAGQIAIFRGCKWFSIGGYVFKDGTRQYVCFYSSERGFSSCYFDCVNGFLLTVA